MTMKMWLGVTAAALLSLGLQPAHAETAPTYPGSNGVVSWAYPKLHLGAPDGRTSRVLDLPVPYLGEQVFSPDGSRIAFKGASNHHAPYIYVVRTNGDGLRAVTRACNSDPAQHRRSCGDELPAWSPDGRTIAFVRTNSNGTESSIYRTKVRRGSTPILLTSQGWRGDDPEWHPDGRHIFFIDSDENGVRLVVMRSDGSDQRTLEDDPEDGALYSFSVAPTGEWLVYNQIIQTASSSDYSVGRVDVDSGARLPLGGPGAMDAQISPNGEKVAYEVETGSGCALRLMDPVGEDIRTVRTSRRCTLKYVWSPDSRKILASTGPNGGKAKLWVINLKTGDRHQVAAGVSSIVSLAWQAR